MIFSLSTNTQAILLLTAPLIAGRGDSSYDLLKPSEYKRLARYFIEIKKQPADLLSSESNSLIESCGHLVEKERMERLLGRGFLLSQVVERWRTRSIWVVSRADAEYPRRLKKALKGDAPPILYGCGDISLLDTGGLAVVGPRKVDEALIDYTTKIGQLCAKYNRTIISGGAKGVDLAAMTSAQANGGFVCNVMAENLNKAAVSRDNREHILEKKLVLVSAYDPNAGFNVGHAMQRNKLIYALSEAALVVNSDVNRGGTWAGAIEQLEKLNLVPIYVRSTGEASQGLDMLRSRGALLWPNPLSHDELSEVFNKQCTVNNLSSMKVNGSLFDGGYNNVTTHINLQSESISSEPIQFGEQINPAEKVFSTVREVLLGLLIEPMSEQEIASELMISRSQANTWLVRLINEDILLKLTRPVRYVVKS